MIWKKITTFISADNATFIAKSLVYATVVYGAFAAYMMLETTKVWENLLTKQLKTMEKVDIPIEQACEIVGCSQFYIGNIKVVHQREGDLFLDVDSKAAKAISTDFTYSNGHIIVSYKKGILDIFMFSLFAYITFVALIGFIMFRFFMNANIDRLVSGAEKTAMLHNRNMAMLAEQLRHELSTPLAVIKELCDDTFSAIVDGATCDILSKTGPCKNCKAVNSYMTISSSKDIIYMNIKQAYSIIDRMAEVKSIRYSNGNKSLYDIAKATFDIMGVYNRSNYSYEIDEKLRKFIIDESAELKNYELMNILLNHVKNSLEASASFIEVRFMDKYRIKPSYIQRHVMSLIRVLGKHQNIFTNSIVSLLSRIINIKKASDKLYCSMLLIDNGIGIDDSIKGQVFNLNYSTKAKDGSVRGAGLYINREILRSTGGDIVIEKSSKRGTVFRLDIPVREKI